MPQTNTLLLSCSNNNEVSVAGVKQVWDRVTRDWIREVQRVDHIGGHYKDLIFVQDFEQRIDMK